MTEEALQESALSEAAPLEGMLSEDARRIALREATLEAGGAGLVGELVDVVVDPQDSQGVVTVRFAANLEGYRGWQWSVTLAVVDPARPTVSEVVLLPGPDALLAPAWVPWKQRVRSGDLGVGDLLPPAPDDARIVPAYLESDDPAVEDLAHEVGVGRVRVLSREGRALAAARWHEGAFGPEDEMAKHAPGHCATCAFFVPLAGSLGAGFGVCANEFSPADGRVVDVRYGCGAHSESAFRPRAAQAADAVVDELRLEVHQRSAELDASVADASVADTAEMPGDDGVFVDDAAFVDDAVRAGGAGPSGSADLFDDDVRAEGEGPFESGGIADDDVRAEGDAVADGPERGEVAH